MPIFRFEFEESGNIEIVEVDLANAEAACAQAVQEARDTLADGVANKVDRFASVTKIYDEAGYLVGTINFADHVSDVRLPKDKDDEQPDRSVVMRSG
jgi:hypothetical protein